MLNAKGLGDHMGTTGPAYGQITPKRYFASNVLASLVAEGLLHVLGDRLGWFPKYFWWESAVIVFVAGVMAGFWVARKTRMPAAGVIGTAAVTALAVIGVGTAAQAGWFGWFPEHPWSTAYVTSMVILVVAVCAVWYTGRPNLIPAVVRGWAVLGLVILGIAKLVQPDMLSRAWNLVTVDLWLTSLILLLVVILISCIYDIRPSVRVRAGSNATQGKEQLPRYIRLVS